MVANVLFAEPQTAQDKMFAIEAKLSAITTLSLLACDEECARNVLETGSLVKVRRRVRRSMKNRENVY
jgi:FKBP-type peptidyl-prolyl cis-trans isomerase (trigger factor)